MGHALSFLWTKIGRDIDYEWELKGQIFPRAQDWSQVVDETWEGSGLRIYSRRVVGRGNISIMLVYPSKEASPHRLMDQKAPIARVIKAILCHLFMGVCCC